MPKPVVFLDKDGTLIENVPYNADPTLIRLLPGVGLGSRALHDAGWRLAVVSNQSGVARGLFPESALVGVEARLRELLGEFGVPLVGFFYCPRHPEGVIPEYAIGCDCRKPAPGLVLTAALQLEIDPRDCWVVGDSVSDVEAGNRAGCRTILIERDHDVRAAAKAIPPDVRVPDFASVVSAIIGSILRPRA
jgi:D-glycero-D-manno-heptose 1,7-bisphosphate phosphatase